MLELNVCQSQVTQYLFFLSTDFDRGLRNADTAWIIKTIYQSVEEGIELYGATKVDKTKLI